VDILKVITEAVLREEFRNSRPEIYYIPEGKILSPAGREYLQQLKIKILAGEKPKSLSKKGLSAPKGQKPEHMTHLYENVLVDKNHPRILFRGKLDSLQALVVMTQCQILEDRGSEALVNNLQEILDALRRMMRCDVLGEPFQNESIMGLNHAQLRERSHAPMKFYNIKQMILPHYSMGKVYGLLNQVRTAVRETELAAVGAFKEGSKQTRNDIIEELNKLSSAVHILMCMYLAGEFK